MGEASGRQGDDTKKSLVNVRYSTRATKRARYSILSNAALSLLASLLSLDGFDLVPQSPIVAERRLLLDHGLQPNDSHVDETVVALRKAFDFARSKRFDLAEQTVQEAVRKVTEKRAQGYLKQQLAEYVHHNDQVKAQELQLAAVQSNPALVRPVSGIAYRRIARPPRPSLS
jgi:hypothetical protein